MTVAYLEQAEEQSTNTLDETRTPIEWIKTCVDPDLTGMPHHNVAELLTDNELMRIGQLVCYKYELDKQSLADWKNTNEEAVKIVRQVYERKTFPWPGAASIKYPLITNACIMFAARAYPALVQGREVVKCSVQGQDDSGQKKNRAIRVGEHMSYQLLQEMEEWEEELDKLLHIVPAMGTCFRKTYFDPTEQRNRSDLVLPEDLVMHYQTRSMEKCRCMTHVYELRANDLWERIASGIWLNAEIPVQANEEPESTQMAEPPHIILEQHSWFDLDGDGYQEPYIITVHRDTQKVLRIVARFDAKGVDIDPDTRSVIRIKPVQYFTKFGFIPSLDGSVYDIGFGMLMYPINSAINSLINQLIDAGTLNNLQSGWIDRSLRERKGHLPFQPGEWRSTDTRGGDLRSKIIPLPTKEPSGALFQLLGLLVEAGKEMGLIKDVLMGDPPGGNTPATTVLAMIEQGLKTFSAIYKRIYRSLSKEYKKLYRLNSIYLDEQVYFTLLDDPDTKDIGRKDYALDDMDIVPIADPTMASDVQKLSRASAIVQLLGPRPNVNQDEIDKRLVDALQVPNADRLIIPPEQRQPQPDPKLLIEQARVSMEKERLDLEWAKFDSSLEELAAKIAKLDADAAKSIAQAEATEAGPQMQQYMAQLKSMTDVARERIKARNLRLQDKNEQEAKAVVQRRQAEQAALQQQGGQIGENAPYETSGGGLEGPGGNEGNSFPPEG